MKFFYRIVEKRFFPKKRWKTRKSKKQERKSHLLFRLAVNFDHLTHTKAKQNLISCKKKKVLLKPKVNLLWKAQLCFQNSKPSKRIQLSSYSHTLPYKLIMWPRRRRDGWVRFRRLLILITSFFQIVKSSEYYILYSVDSKAALFFVPGVSV